jgi:hypothetical protein
VKPGTSETARTSPAEPGKMGRDSAAGETW